MTTITKKSGVAMNPSVLMPREHVPSLDLPLTML